MKKITITCQQAPCIEEVQIDVVIEEELPAWSHTTTCYGSAGAFMKDPIKAVADALHAALHP